MFNPNSVHTIQNNYEIYNFHYNHICWVTLSFDTPNIFLFDKMTV